MEGLKEKLEHKFSGQIISYDQPKPNRVYVRAATSALKDILKYAMNELGFDHLSTITGVDKKTEFEAIYHLFGKGTILSIGVKVSREDPRIETITDIIPGAVLYERELQDFFGFKVGNIPDGRRLILPEEWPSDQFPLRKDWDQSMIPKSMTEGLRREWTE